MDAKGTGGRTAGPGTKDWRRAEAGLTGAECPGEAGQVQECGCRARRLLRNRGLGTG